MSEWDGEYHEWLQGVEKPLHFWTNVWQAGRIIECMMRLKTFVDDEAASIVCLEESHIKDTAPPRIDGWPNFRYSHDLIDLVWRCQRLDPEDRPTPSELLKLIKQRAPKHNRGMEDWGNSTWIRNREETPRPNIYGGVTRRSEILKERVKAGRLNFLNGYPLDWARRYYQLDVDLPVGCDLAFYGNKDPAKLNTIAVIPPKKPEWGCW